MTENEQPNDRDEQGDAPEEQAPEEQAEDQPSDQAPEEQASDQAPEEQASDQAPEEQASPAAEGSEAGEDQPDEQVPPPPPGEAPAGPADTPASSADASDTPAGPADTPDAPAASDEAASDQPEPRERPPRRRDGEPEPAAPEVVPGADLEPDLVLDEQPREDRYAEAAERYPDDDAGEPQEPAAADAAPEAEPAPAAQTPMALAADARYRATGKRKTSVARVILRPGDGSYTINGRPLDEFFPRPTLQKTAREPLLTAGYETRLDVVAKLHGGGVSSQAGALRHGIARALVEADPNLRGELKRQGFLTRDPRVKERKKAGLKKARKRPQFSKR